MRSYFLISILFFGLIGFMSSCKNDEVGNGIEMTSYLDGNYSPGNDENELSATIDKTSVSSKSSVTFRSSSNKKGYMKLIEFFEDFPSIEIEDIQLKEVVKDDYKQLEFSGNKTVGSSLRFEYSGYIIMGELHLELLVK